LPWPEPAAEPRPTSEDAAAAAALDPLPAPGDDIATDDAATAPEFPLEVGAMV
jgi:hypothetical protein